MHARYLGSCLVAAASLAALVLLVPPAVLLAQQAALEAAPPASRSGEARASRAYQDAVRQGPLAVQAFLADFPKGADLHFHLTAGVYAETLIRVAAEDKVCIDPAKGDFARDEQGKILKDPCAPPLVPASELNGS